MLINIWGSRPKADLICCVSFNLADNAVEFGTAKDFDPARDYLMGEATGRERWHMIGGTMPVWAAFPILYAGWRRRMTPLAANFVNGTTGKADFAAARMAALGSGLIDSRQHKRQLLKIDQDPSGAYLRLAVLLGWQPPEVRPEFVAPERATRFLIVSPSELAKFQTEANQYHSAHGGSP
jgi:hypothetical protein